MEVLSLRFINSTKKPEDKMVISLNYYEFIMLALRRVIRIANNGITFQELKCLQRFVAFAYFRLPWVQDVIIYSFGKASDPVLNSQKLSEIGAGIGCKSPSKSYVFDWELFVYGSVRKQSEYITEMVKLQETHEKNREWAKLLFNRDYEDLFYGLYS